MISLDKILHAYPHATKFDVKVFKEQSGLFKKCRNVKFNMHNMTCLKNNIIHVLKLSHYRFENIFIFRFKAVYRQGS